MIKPRVLFVGPMLGRYPGWVPAPAEELAPRLAERGFSCLLTSSVLNRYRRAVDILSTIVRLRSQFDILCLQVYGGPSFVIEDLVSWLVQRLGKPVVMVLHGGNMPEFMARFSRWTRHVLQRSMCIIAPSTYLSNAVGQYGFTAQVIPNALDLSLYPYRHREQVAPSLLWMRTYHEIYNPLMAVETLDRVRREIPFATLTMAGQEKGSLTTVHELVKQLGLSKLVRFAGFLDIAGKQHEFSRHDIFLNTNRVDNMPVSILEASAFGMPIIATSVGGVPYMILDGENGLLVPNEDSAAMASAVIRLVKEPGLARRLSENAYRMAERLDWSVVLPQWEHMFLKVMGEKL